MIRLLLRSFLLLALLLPLAVDAALIDRVNEAFRSVHDRTPTFSEWSYWAGRVQRGEKTTFEALVGAIAYQKAEATGTSPAAPSSVPSASTFKTDPRYYPSAHNPNFLPEGTLVKSSSSPNVYYIRDGKKSWVMPSILDKWLRENHFFKSDIVITIPEADLARYGAAFSVNKMYVGKVLRHPNGTQFYIDDKLRKRQLPASVRTALRFPGGNIYPTTAAHLSEFPTGPAITDTSKHPGGMAIYDGPYHGGRIWKTQELSNGAIAKRLYLKDRFYEADGYPDESQRAPVDAAMLARHPRGINIDRYPDGWVIGIGTDIYLMQGGKRRLITSPDIFAAMGYKSSHVRKEFPELFLQLPQGDPIRAFKGITVNGAAADRGAPAPAPTTASHLLKVRPAIRTIIGEMNTTYRSVFDKEVTSSENAFWVDYVYRGEVSTKADLVAAMQRTKETSRKPSLTSRTAVLSETLLEQKWFPYLFYFVHQKEPSDADKAYWFSRIEPGDRDTIEKLGGTLQWLKDNQGTTRR